jgi:nitrate reductase NapAB chaperone NapD
VSSSKIHIAGMLVHTRTDAMESAMAVARRFGAEVHASGIAGKFVAVLETAHEREIADCIEHVQAVAGVIAVSMTSHYIEDAAALAAEMPS